MDIKFSKDLTKGKIAEIAKFGAGGKIKQKII